MKRPTLDRLTLPRRAWLLRGVGALRWLIVLAWIWVWAAGTLGWWRPPRGSGNWIGTFMASLFAIALLSGWIRWQRERQIREAAIPQFLKRKLRDIYPQLSAKDCDLVERGLRQYFLACLRSRKKFVAMPSQVVDAMWHEFILHTRAYSDWCELTLGRFLHHTPAEALGGNGKRNDGLRRAWFWACKDEAINPKTPTRLPLLFALDAKLGIANGFHYVPDCGDIGRKSDKNGDGGGSYCGGSFNDDSYSGDADGFGGSDTSSDAGGDGGDGGGGCGGD
jgi:hypothetical protein